VVNYVSWSPQNNIFITGSDDTSVKVWACDTMKIEVSGSKATLVRSLNAQRQDSSDSDGNEDQPMHEDFKSRGSDEYMSENEEDPDED